ncbi:hypothetical protein FQA39_LY18384 [Lamprigera yunnana]|nr:hypothetical protein FQA39_LY18384 [Lamprigera yunnana]
MTKMGDDGNSTTIQSQKIEENKEARSDQRKKKKMAARSLDSNGESGNISRDITMPSLPTTPIQSYPSPGLKRWLSALTPPSLSSPSILSMSQRQKLSPSSSSDLIHQKYHPVPRQYIEKLFVDGSGPTVDFNYGIHYDSHKKVGLWNIANIIPSVVKMMVLELVRENDMLIADLKTKFDSFTPQVVSIPKEILTKIPNSIKIAVEESTKERNIIVDDLKAQL